MTGVDFKIRASQRLLLKAAFSQNKQEGAAALSQWWGRVGDFHEVQGTDASIFPEIYGNLGAYISDPKLAARMRGVARHHWLKNKYLIRFCAELLNHLADAGIPVLLLKGVAIATAIDRDPGLRAMNDCDVLVPRSLAIRAVRILESTGLIEKAFVDARDLDIIHGVTLFHSGTGLGHLDVHWRPLRPIGSEEFGKEMFDAARPVSFDDRECLAPCPEHLLFQSIVHGVEWSPAPNYGWLVDVTKILRRVGTDFDWERLIDVARRYHYLFLIRSALREARTHCGVTIPRWADRRLSAWFAPLERREIRASLSRPTTRSTADELLLGLQKTRRGAVENLGRPPWRAGAQLLGRLLGPSFAGGVAGSIGMDPDQVTLLYGWSAPEPTGRWTEGRLASFAIRASEPQPATALKLRGFPLGGKGVRPHVVEVFAGFRRLGAIVWPPFGTFPYAQTIPLPSRIWKNGVAVLRLDMPTRMSPVEMGISYDARAGNLRRGDLTQPTGTRSDGAIAGPDQRRRRPRRDVAWLVISRTARVLDVWTDLVLALARIGSDQGLFDAACRGRDAGART